MLSDIDKVGFFTIKASDVARGRIQTRRTALYINFMGLKHIGFIANALAWQNLQMIIIV